jgi:hypothetical protein
MHYGLILRTLLLSAFIYERRCYSNCQEGARNMTHPYCCFSTLTTTIDTATAPWGADHDCHSCRNRHVAIPRLRDPRLSLSSAPSSFRCPSGSAHLSRIRTPPSCQSYVGCTIPFRNSHSCSQLKHPHLNAPPCDVK